MLGIFTYGQEALGKTAPSDKESFGIYKVQENDTTSDIVLRATRNGANWETSWVIVVDNKGNVRGNKHLIQPGWQIWIAKEKIKTAAVQVKQSLETVCAFYINSECLKSLSKINDVSDVTLALNNPIYIPNDFQPKVTLKRLVPTIVRETEISQSYAALWTFALLAGIVTALIGARHINLVPPATQLPKRSVPSITLPSTALTKLNFQIPRLSEKREKLALIRRDIIHRLEKRQIPFNSSLLQTESWLWRPRVVYCDPSYGGQIYGVFTDAVAAYKPAEAKRYGRLRFEGLGHYEIPGIEFPGLRRVSLERLREIGTHWLEPELGDFENRFMKKFPGYLADQFNQEPFDFVRTIDVENGTWTCRIVPTPGNELDRDSMETRIDETLQQIGDPRYCKKGFIYQNSVGIVEITFMERKAA